MSIKQENLSFYNQSKLIPEIGDTVQVTPTGLRTRIDLGEHPLLKESLLKLRESRIAAEVVVASAGSTTTTATTSTVDVIDVDDDENVSAKTTSVEDGKQLPSSSSIWDDQQKQMMFWEKNLSDFISASLLSLTQSTTTSSSSSSTANPNVIVNNNNNNNNSNFKPMVFPKAASEVLKPGTNINNVLKPSQRGIVNMLFTMKKKMNDAEKKQLDAAEDASSSSVAVAAAITSDMTFAFTEDASPSTATTEQETPSDKANGDGGESKKGTNATATGGGIGDDSSEWDFSTVQLFEHPNYTAKCARLRNITTCKGDATTSSQRKGDDVQKLEGTHQDSAPQGQHAPTSSSTAFSTLVFLGEDRLKVHVERDRKIIRDLEGTKGRYLFSLVRLDNLLFGLVLPVIDYDILMSGGGGGEDNADESVSSSSFQTSSKNSKQKNNNNNNNNNNAPSFLVRSFTGQRVSLRPPSEDENMKRFKAESKLSYPELADCVDPSIASTNSTENNNNNNTNNTKNNIYYSTTSPETFFKIVSMSTGGDSNSTQQNSPQIYGTIVEIRRHVKFATQFVACVLVDAPKLGVKVPSGSKAAEFSECPVFSSFLQVSSTIPRFFIACHSSELLPLPPTSQQRQQQASNNNGSNNDAAAATTTSTSVVPGSKRRERANANSQIADNNNSSKKTEESKSVTKDLAGAPKTPLNSAAAVVPANNKTTKSTTAVTAGISLSTNNDKSASSTQVLNNNNNNNNGQQQQQSGLPQQDFQKLLKTIYGVDVASTDEAARIVSDGVPEKQETYNAHVFRSKFFSRNPTTVLKTALTLHSCLIGSQSGGGQFRRMYGTGIGAWALNNISHQQQQQQQGQASKQQNGGNNASTTKSHAAKMFG